MDDIPALIKRLEAGLEGVTPGPWYSEGTAVFFDTRKLACCGKGTFECCGNPDIDGDYGPVAETSETGARHIANCDPDTIRTLLSALQAQAAEIERLRKQVAPDEVPGPSHDEVMAKMEAKLREAVKLLTRVKAAWEALPGGKDYPPPVIQAWLMEDMQPAINDVRAFLAGLNENASADLSAEAVQRGGSDTKQEP